MKKMQRRLCLIKMLGDKEIDIKDHAIDRYIQRVLDKTLKESTRNDRKFAKHEILMAVRHPKRVVAKKDEEEDEFLPQIHVSNGFSVIVGHPTEERGVYRPYYKDDDEVVVPTVYGSVKYGGEDDNKERAQA